MSDSAAKKKANELKTPWRVNALGNSGTARIYDRTNVEILVCATKHAEAIVNAVNWCARRGYLGGLATNPHKLTVGTDGKLYRRKDLK